MSLSFSQAVAQQRVTKLQNAQLSVRLHHFAQSVVVLHQKMQLSRTFSLHMHGVSSHVADHAM
jgi:hypothetical protein